MAAFAIFPVPIPAFRGVHTLATKNTQLLRLMRTDRGGDRFRSGYSGGGGAAPGANKREAPLISRHNKKPFGVCWNWLDGKCTIANCSFPHALPSGITEKSGKYGRRAGNSGVSGGHADSSGSGGRAGASGGGDGVNGCGGASSALVVRNRARGVNE